MDPHVISMEELKNRLLESTQESETLRAHLTEIQQNNMLNDAEAMAIQQENDTLKLQIATFEDEHQKWQMERTQLLQDLYLTQQEHEMAKEEEEQLLQSAEKQFHQIDKLSKHRRKSVLDLQVSLHKISHLTQQNQDSYTELDELRNINAEYQQKVLRLHQQIDELHVENGDLQQQNDFLLGQLELAKETAERISNDLVSKQVVAYEEKQNVALTRLNHDINGAIPSPKAARILFTPNGVAMQRNVSYNEQQTQPSAPNSDRMSTGTVSPIVRRRSRSRSVESDAIMHDMVHVDHDDEDEKESTSQDQTHEHLDFVDDHKLRTEIEAELQHKFEQEQLDEKERYESLQRKYKELQQKYEQNIIDHRSLLEMREDKKFKCNILPWNCR